MGDQQRMQVQAVQPPLEAQPEETEIDLIELMYRLLGSWKLICSLALAGALIAGVITLFFITPLYESTSTIYVLSRRDSAINMSDLQIGTALTNDYIKVFEMWEVHEEVISDLNLPYTYDEMEDMLTVVNDTNTRMLDITVASPSAEEAAQIANQYAKVASQYIADTMAMDKPSIMSAALVPDNPVKPNKTLNVMLGFLVGALIAIAIVTVRAILDDKYKTSEDIRKYAGLATLAVVPVEEEAVKSRKKSSGGARRMP